MDWAHHPGWIGLRDALPAERVRAFESEVEGILSAANSDPAALQIESPYLVVRVQA